MSKQPRKDQDPRTYVPAREKTPFGQFELKRSHLQTGRPGVKDNGGATSYYDLPFVAPRIPKAGAEREAEEAEQRRAGITVVAQAERLADGDRQVISDVLEALGIKDYEPGKPPSR